MGPRNWFQSGGTAARGWWQARRVTPRKAQAARAARAAHAVRAKRWRGMGLGFWGWGSGWAWGTAGDMGGLALLEAGVGVNTKGGWGRFGLAAVWVEGGGWGPLTGGR